MFYEKQHISLPLSLSLYMMLAPKYTKRYKRKYLGWLQGETRNLHKIFEDKNLTELVHRKISHGVRNSLAASCGFAWCEKSFCCLKWFRMVCKISHNHVKMLLVGFLPLVFFLASLIGLATYCQAWKKAMKCSKAQILHVFELQLALPWI